MDSSPSPSGASPEERELQQQLANVREERDSLFSGEIEGASTHTQSSGQISGQIFNSDLAQPTGQVQVTETNTTTAAATTTATVDGQMLSSSSLKELNDELAREKQEKETMRAELNALRASASNSIRAEDMKLASEKREEKWEKVIEAISPSPSKVSKFSKVSKNKDGGEGEGEGHNLAQGGRERGEGEGGVGGDGAVESENEKLRLELRNALTEAKRADEEHAAYVVKKD